MIFSNNIVFFPKHVQYFATLPRPNLDASRPERVEPLHN